MSGPRYLLPALLAALLLLWGTVSANSAEPPSLIVILKNAPKDTLIVSQTGSSQETPRRSVVAWEQSFIFYYRSLGDADMVYLDVTGGGQSFTIGIPRDEIRSYNSTITLDFGNRSYIVGTSLSRSILLVGIRVLSTLAVEGLIFYAFGFRKRRQWLAFLGINLLTQGMLNIWINVSTSTYLSFAIGFLFAELLVCIAELVLFALLVRQDGKRTGGYVMLANLLSALAGILLITRLPI